MHFKLHCIYIGWQYSVAFVLYGAAFNWVQYDAPSKTHYVPNYICGQQRTHGVWINSVLVYPKWQPIKLR